MVSVRNTTLRERRQVRASLRAIFGAFLDRLQPHSPNQGASRVNHPPVLAELATRGWVGSEHTSVRWRIRQLKLPQPYVEKISERAATASAESSVPERPLPKAIPSRKADQSDYAAAITDVVE